MDTNQDTLMGYKKHPVHYQPYSDLIVIVRDTLFRVASIFFTRESVVFRDCLLGTAANLQPSEVGTDCTPLYILGIPPKANVTPNDFAQFCSVVFNPQYSIYECTTLGDWKVVLRLASQWGFAEVKELSLRKIHALGGGYDLSAVDRSISDPQLDSFTSIAGTPATRARRFNHVPLQSLYTRVKLTIHIVIPAFGYNAPPVPERANDVFTLYTHNDKSQYDTLRCLMDPLPRGGNVITTPTLLLRVLELFRPRSSGSRASSSSGATREARKRRGALGLFDCDLIY